MRKAIYVGVYVDDEAEPQSSVCHQRVGRDLFQLEIYRDPKDIGSLADSLAHELGHVIAAIFETPAQLDDPRTEGGMTAWMLELIGPDAQQQTAMFHAEAEAWDFARKMRTIDETYAQACLDTYKP